MATSPLSAALKPALPADEASEERYQDALRQMTEALDQRKNRLFDPRYLAMAAGIQDPNVRGMGFGAELASGMKAFSEAEERGFEENRKIAEMRLLMAQSEREQARKQQGLKFFDEPTTLAAVAGAAPGIPGAAKAPGEAPGAPAAPSVPGATGAISIGDTSGYGVKIGGREITPNLISRLTLTNPDLGKAVSDQYKMVMDNIVVKEDGYFNKATGQFTPFSGGATVERFIPGTADQKAMTLSLSKQDAALLDQARSRGDTAAMYSIIDRYTKMPARGQLAVGDVPPGSEAPVKRPAGVPAKTPSEAKAAQEVDQEVAKTLAVGEAAAQVKTTTAVKEAGRGSLNLLPLLDRMEVLLQTPGIEKVLGVLERGDVQSGLGSLVEDALRVGNFSIGIPSVRKIIGQSGAPQEVIDKAAEIGQLLAMTQFEQRKGLGSGTSVSNFEQTMVNAMGPNMTDTLKSFKQKLSFLREKAKFESALAKSLRATKMQYDEFKDTPEFEKLFSDYRNTVTRIVYPNAEPTTKPAAQPAARPAAAASSPYTAQSLKDLVKSRRQE